jgi:hypothetical protein
MAVSKTHAPKGPSQDGTAFYKGKQQGGAYGSSSGDHGKKPSGGPMREKIDGKKGL